VAEPELMTGVPPFRAQELVTLANWQDPPFNRWGFQHIRELIPTARISRGAGPAGALPRAEGDLLSLRFRDAGSGRELTVAQLLAETYTDGFLVLHQGQIVAEHYFNGMAQDVPHLLMSVSKSVTSAVAGVLAGRGDLAVSAGVAQIVPELRGTSFQGATVQDLLDMRAGTRFDENYENVEADVRDTEEILSQAARTLDLGQPVAVMLLGLLELRLSYLELTGIPVVVLTRDDTGCKKLVVALHLRARVLEDRLIFLDGRECLAPFLRPRAVDGLAHFRFVLLHLRRRGLDLRLQVCVL